MTAKLKLHSEIFDIELLNNHKNLNLKQDAWSDIVFTATDFMWERMGQIDDAGYAKIIFYDSLNNVTRQLIMYGTKFEKYENDGLYAVSFTNYDDIYTPTTDGKSDILTQVLVCNDPKTKELLYYTGYFDAEVSGVYPPHIVPCTTKNYTNAAKFVFFDEAQIIADELSSRYRHYFRVEEHMYM